MRSFANKSCYIIAVNPTLQASKFFCPAVSSEVAVTEPSQLLQQMASPVSFMWCSPPAADAPSSESNSTATCCLQGAGVGDAVICAIYLTILMRLNQIFV